MLLSKSGLYKYVILQITHKISMSFPLLSSYWMLSSVFLAILFAPVVVYISSLCCKLIKSNDMQEISVVNRRQRNAGLASKANSDAVKRINYRISWWCYTERVPSCTCLGETLVSIVWLILGFLTSDKYRSQQKKSSCTSGYSWKNSWSHLWMPLHYSDDKAVLLLKKTTTSIWWDDLWYVGGISKFTSSIVLYNNILYQLWVCLKVRSYDFFFS